MQLQSNIVSQISEYVEQLSQAKQKDLLKALERNALLKEARGLKSKPNDITMKEICDIVNDVRKARKIKTTK
jgi:hypothetical protein